MAKPKHVEDISFLFLPSVTLPDDPLPQRAYFAWKADICGKRYGNSTMLPDRPKAFDAEMRKSLILKALDEIEEVHRSLKEPQCQP